jgi:predicted pyridoxine 5'-phosphate oxidase superfamily flavin-nucleotide-binding protein
MAKITPEMKEVISKMATPVVATASREGKPNVVPIACVKVISDDEILLMDNFMNKTRANIEANPAVAITVWSMEHHGGYQFKGRARIETQGSIFEDGVKTVKARRPQINPKAAIIVKVEEIYAVGSGPNSGKRLD